MNKTTNDDELRDNLDVKLISHMSLFADARQAQDEKSMGYHFAAIKELFLSDCQRLIERFKTEAVGNDRPYEKYEPCPVCGSQYQYKCSCDEADSVVRNEIRQRISIIKQEEIGV